MAWQLQERQAVFICTCREMVYLYRHIITVMPRAKKQVYTFTAPLEEVDWQFMNTIVRVPDNILKALPTGRIRIEGSFNDAPVNLGIQSRKEGFHYLSVSASLRRAAHIKSGDRVVVTFTIADPEELDMPEEMEAVLAQDDEAFAVWKELTTGKKRGILHYINSVKNIDSRIKRALFMAEKMKRGELQVQADKSKKDRD